MPTPSTEAVELDHIYAHHLQLFMYPNFSEVEEQCGPQTATLGLNKKVCVPGVRGSQCMGSPWPGCLQVLSHFTVSDNSRSKHRPLYSPVQLLDWACHNERNLWKHLNCNLAVKRATCKLSLLAYNFSLCMHSEVCKCTLYTSGLKKKCIQSKV